MAGNRAGPQRVQFGVRGAVILLVGAVLLAGCAGGSAGGPEVEGSWELAEGRADGVALPFPTGARATLTLGEGQAGGVSFCNHYAAEYRIDGDTIAFAALGGTEMGCEPDVMTAETAYLRALAAADTVTLDGTDLLLTGDGVELRYRAVPPVPTSELVGTEWVLDTLLDDDTASSVLGTPTLRLDPDGAVTGSTGCRDITGTWTTRGDLVVLETLDAGTSDCPEELRFQDDHVLAVLGDGFQVSIEENRLTALDPDGRGLVYRAG